MPFPIPDIQVPTHHDLPDPFLLIVPGRVSHSSLAERPRFVPLRHAGEQSRHRRRPGASGVGKESQILVHVQGRDSVFRNQREGRHERGSGVPVHREERLKKRSRGGNLPPRRRRRGRSAGIEEGRVLLSPGFRTQRAFECLECVGMLVSGR
jgi:hypothetical protein